MDWLAGHGLWVKRTLHIAHGASSAETRRPLTRLFPDHRSSSQQLTLSKKSVEKLWVCLVHQSLNNRDPY